MAVRAIAVNPNVLAWARIQAGLSVDEVARQTNQSVEKVSAWESGADVPTYGQLETLADTLYKRPVALFFLPAPPAEPSIERQFRTLPVAEVQRLDPDTRYALREAMAFQLSLYELAEGQNPSPRPIHMTLRVDPEEDPKSFASRVRQHLGVTVNDQVRWRSTSEAMNQWREVVESAGVFVRKRAFKQRDISGFCVWNDTFPVIVINNSTSFSRQIFTLFHELAHVLYRVSSITRKENEFIGELSHDARVVERGCNTLAAEFLVPRESFNPQNLRGNPLDQFVSSAARRYHVSREVILRRLLDVGLVSQETYQDRVDEWNDDYERHIEGAGGNYYATAATYLGRTYLDLAFRQFYAGKLSLPDLADHFGMKARNIPKLEAFLRLGG